MPSNVLYLDSHRFAISSSKWKFWQIQPNERLLYSFFGTDCEFISRITQILVEDYSA